jgi:hypothetical protein
VHKQKCYTVGLHFVMFCTNWTSGETLMQFQHPTCKVFRIILTQCYIIWLKSSCERRCELSISRHFNTKPVSSQEFRLTPRTEHQCVPFCDYSEVQAKYRLNISLCFNPQPTPFIVTKYRHTIQLHILSVDTAI